MLANSMSVYQRTMLCTGGIGNRANALYLPSQTCLHLQWLGKLSFVLVPALVLVAVLVGAFAAKTYDSGATSYLAP